MLAARHFNSRGFATKTLLIAAGIAFGIVALLGFGAFALQRSLPSTPSNGQVTLTYWGLWESKDLIQPLLDQYHKLHPNITISYEQRPIDNHFETVKSRIKTAGEGAPDIVRLHDSWVPALRNDLSALPSSVMNASQYESTFYSVNRDELYSKDQYYAMPLEVDGLSLVYNQDLFNKAGITAPPVTWDDLRQDASKLTQRDENGKLLVGGVAMGTANNIDHFADIVGLLMAQNGVVFVDKDGKANFQNTTTPDGRNLGGEALSFYTMFSSTEKDWDDTMEQSTLAFADGKVAMIFIPSWRLLSLVNQNPNLPLRVAPVPHLTTDQKTGYGSYWVEAVPKVSKHQTEAWQFLKWLTDKDQQMALAQGQQQTRPFGEPYSRKDLGNRLQGDKYLQAYISQADSLRTSFFAGGTGNNEFNDAINSALADAISQSQRSGDSNQAAQALQKVADAVNKALGK